MKCGLMGPLLIPWYFCQLVIKYAIKRDTPCSKADTLLRFAEPNDFLRVGWAGGSYILINTILGYRIGIDILFVN